MEYDFKNVDEVIKKINDLELQRLELMKTGGIGIRKAEDLRLEINKLKLIKYDMINNTHTYELYILKCKLRSALLRYSLADVRNRKHYAIQIRYYKNEIKELEEKDEGLIKLLKK